MQGTGSQPHGRDFSLDSLRPIPDYQRGTMVGAQMHNEYASP